MTARALLLMLCLGPVAQDANGQVSSQCGHQEINFARLPSWSADGTKIAFECSGICVMNADGTGKTTRSVAPGDSVDRQPAWSPDGQKMAFIRQMNKTYLYVMNADGTGATRVSNGYSGPESPAWSPDEKKIAFFDDGPEGAAIYVMSADGQGKPVRLAAGAAGRSARPAWSRDGARIAFENSEGRLVVAGADGKSRTTLAFEPASDPTWSATGEKIAFATYVSGQHAVFVINADGTNPTRLTTEGDNEEPAWSPDGKKIAFTSERDGTPTTYVMNADGTNQTSLFNMPVALSHLAWSPRGRRIAFVALGRYGVDGIYTIDEDGSNQRRLTSGPANRDERPAWSPDGQKIAFTRIRNKGGSHLYLMNADGSQLSEVTNDAESVAWLPDGRAVAFKAFGDGSRPIRRINVDGTGQATLIKSFDTFGDPVFSPDGRRIAFQGAYGGAGVLHVLKSDGSGDETIAKNVYTAYSVRPAWSADGGTLAFTHDRVGDGCEGIDVVNADGTGRITLTSSGDSNPSWSPDAKRIAFVGTRDGYDAIYVMNADGSLPIRITRDFRQEAPDETRARQFHVSAGGAVALGALAFGALALGALALRGKRRR